MLEVKGTTEDEMVGWHHRLSGHEFKQSQGASEGQESLVCCSPWGYEESDMTEQLNRTELRELVRRARPRVGAQRQGTGSQSIPGAP